MTLSAWDWSRLQEAMRSKAFEQLQSICTMRRLLDTHTHKHHNPQPPPTQTHTHTRWSGFVYAMTLVHTCTRKPSAPENLIFSEVLKQKELKEVLRIDRCKGEGPIKCSFLTLMLTLYLFLSHTYTCTLAQTHMYTLTHSL